MGPSPSAREVQPAPDATIALLDGTIARARGSALYRERLAGTRIRTLDDLRAVPLTTRADLQAAGTHGTRALPLEQVCHYGESSGTSGASNSTWLTAGDFLRDARAIRASHPGVFAPGRIILNRYPFMAAPAHILQLVAHEGAPVDADRRDDEPPRRARLHRRVAPLVEQLAVRERRLDVQRPRRARSPEEHRLGGPVELDHPCAPRARHPAPHRGRQRRAAEEERVDAEPGRVDALGLRDLAEDDRLERQAGDHVRAGPAREVERPGERHVPVDVPRGDRDAPALLRDELEDVRRAGSS